MAKSFQAGIKDSLDFVLEQRLSWSFLQKKDTENVELAVTFLEVLLLTSMSKLWEKELLLNNQMSLPKLMQTRMEFLPKKRSLLGSKT